MKRHIYLRTAIIIVFVIVVILVIMPSINKTAFALNDAVTEADCRMCHCYAVPDTHHLLVEAGTYECLNCHQVKWDDVSQIYYTELIRDCIACHGSVVGDTHHLLVQANRYECLDCHKLTLDNASQQYIVELNFTCISGQSSNISPVADAGLDQTVPAGQSASFSGAGSYDPDGSITYYAWDFGDGYTGTGITAAHTYNIAGTYKVTLSVTDDKGAVGTDTAVITVQQVILNKPPVAEAGPDQTVIQGKPLSFSAKASYDPDGYILSYAWDFGDGYTATGITTTHTYDNPGSYTATLRVTDNKGAVDTDTAVVMVKLGSNPNKVYADEVLWNTLTNVADPDSMGIVEDITTKFIDARSSSHFDIANQSNNSAKIISMKVAIEPKIISQAVIRFQIRELPKNSIQNVRIYPYNYDGKTIILNSYLNYRISSNGFVDLDVTPLISAMKGFGWMKFRITSTTGRIWISKGNFILR